MHQKFARSVIVQYLDTIGFREHAPLPVVDRRLCLSILPLLQQGYGDIDEVSKLLLREAKSLTQPFNAFCEVRWHAIASGENAHYDLLLTRQRERHRI